MKIPPAGSDGERLHLDLQHAAAVARVIAAARLLFATTALVAVVFDHPAQLAFGSPLVAAGLALTAAVSAVVLLLCHVVPLAVVRFGPWLHVWDIGWISTLLALTDGANSPFVAYFVFALLASAFQWRFAATLTTGVVAIVVIIGAAVIQDIWQVGSYVHLYAVLPRATAIVLGTLLVAHLAEKEWLQRLRSMAVTRIMSRVTAGGGFVSSVRAVLGGLLAESGAQRAVLAIEEEGSPRVFVWSATRRRADHVDVRLREVARTSCDTYMFALPHDIGAIRVRRGRRSLRLLALDRNGIARTWNGLSADSLLKTPFDWNTALCLPAVSGDGWTSRLFVFDPAAWRGGRSHIRFIQAVSSQVGPALFNVYLQRRLQSRSGGRERTTLARAMHDNTLQSLIGAEMELELLQREPRTDLSARDRERLTYVQQLLAEQVLELRDVVQALKHVDIEPDRFLEHIEDLVRRFRDSTGIDARLLCEVKDVELAARTCRELASVVREALVNIRKHARASAVVVRLSGGDEGWRLDIADDGRGFDFRGRLGDEELELQRRGPLIIRERVKDIGGRLLVDSQPGHGSTLEITIPARAS